MNRPYLIGITGGSGSGKTTFIKSLEEKFSKEDVCVFSQDNYYKTREEQLEDEQGIINFDLPSCFNEDAYANDIQRLLNNETIVIDEYTFNNSLVESKKLTFHPSKVIIIEGIFVFHFKKIAELLDLKLFIDAPENTKLIRRIKRDNTERNYPLDDVLYRYENHVTPSYNKYILPYKESADVIINNVKKYDNALEVINAFIKSKL